MGKHITLNSEAPQFTLKDTRDEEIRLSNFKGNQIVVLVLNRGFV